MVGTERSKRLLDAFITAGFTAIISLVMGLAVWYTVVEKRMALLETKQIAQQTQIDKNEAGITALMKDHVTRDDLKKVENKLDSANSKLEYISGVLDGSKGRK